MYDSPGVSTLRERLFEIIEASKGQDTASGIYDACMMGVILCSMVPLCFKQSNSLFTAVEAVTTAIFVVDYSLRLITADFKLRRGPISFLLYPFTFMAMIDLLSILPSFTVLAPGLRILKLLRMLRTFRVLKVLKVFKTFRYSKSIDIIIDVIRSQREPLAAVGTLAFGYILIAALVIFNVEPQTFDNFFEAIYWACVSLTTMGYGDIYPVTEAGRLVTMVSSFVGIAIVALPSGIITAGYMDEIRRR